MSVPGAMLAQLSWWRVGIFLAAYGLMLALLGQWSAADRLFIEILTVDPAAAILSALTPEIGVQVQGARLTAPGGGISVRNGCEGLDCYLLITSAFLVAPLSWRGKALGWLLGIGLAWLLNMARVVALFYSFRADRVWFDMIHGTLAPIVIVAVLAGFFAVWLGRWPPPATAAQ